MSRYFSRWQEKSIGVHVVLVLLLIGILFIAGCENISKNFMPLSPEALAQDSKGIGF